MNFTPPLLSTIKARTLIVHGDRDPLYPVHLAAEMYAAIPMAERFVETALAFLRGEWRV